MRGRGAIAAALVALLAAGCGQSTARVPLPGAGAPPATRLAAAVHELAGHGPVRISIHSVYSAPRESMGPDTDLYSGTVDYAVPRAEYAVSVRSPSETESQRKAQLTLISDWDHTYIHYPVPDGYNGPPTPWFGGANKTGREPCSNANMERDLMLDLPLFLAHPRSVRADGDELVAQVDLLHSRLDTGKSFSTPVGQAAFMFAIALAPPAAGDIESAPITFHVKLDDQGRILQVHVHERTNCDGLIAPLDYVATYDDSSGAQPVPSRPPGPIATQNS